jgi:hypothetical protein
MRVNARAHARPGAHETPDATHGDPAALAHAPLFEPLRGLLLALRSPLPCDLDALNALLAGCAEAHAAAPGLRFVGPDAAGFGYETRIVERAEVSTRPGSWHDFFNALVWMRFPHTKRALAGLHAAGLRSPRPDGRRGPLRDAATQFDESGVVVAASDPDLLALLAERRWRTLFWDRRRDVDRHMRFLVFGHGVYDALRAPFYRMCGRAALVCLAQERIEVGMEGLCAVVDRILAERFAARTWYPRPKALLALPLLGIPGVCIDNEQPGYYDDTLQFRPPPAA